MADQVHSCSHCSKQFSSHSGLLRHLKKEHGVESEGGIKCLEENCKFPYHCTCQLRSHLTQEHAIQMEGELKELSNGKASVTLTT